MTIKQSTIDRLLAEQRGKCANCWRPVPPMEVHHACIPKGQTNYKKHKKELDSGENLVLLCHICHGDHGKLTNWYQRWSFFTDKLDQGYDMQKWLDALGLRAGEYFVYLGKNKKYNKEYKSNG